MIFITLNIGVKKIIVNILKNFKDFKDFCLISENLQKYYHGTSIPIGDNIFNKFQRNKGIRVYGIVNQTYDVISSWIFLSDNLNIAKKFAYSKSDYNNQRKRTHTNSVITTEIDTKKLKTLDLTVEEDSDIEEELIRIGLTDMELYNIEMDENEFYSVPKSYGMSIYSYWGLGWEKDQLWKLLDNENISIKIKKAGYNSVKLLEPDGNGISLAIDIDKQEDLIKIIK